jgi:hypothetical protein
LPQFSPRQYEGILANRANLEGQPLTRSIVAWANKEGENRLRQIVDRWNVAAYVSRRQIFEEALWAHAERKYYVVVPALIAQAEGIVRTSLGVAMSGVAQSYHFEKVRKQFASRLRTLTKLTKKEKMSVGHIRAFENNHNIAVVESVFESFNPATDPVPVTLNRHAIAHGIALDYGTEEQSTKAFLFLDMLHALCVQVEETI